MENFCRRWVIPLWIFNIITWSVFLGACDKLHMERVASPEEVTIRWIKETPTSCGNVPGHINACATNSADFTRCTIRMPESTPDSTIAEEFRHCFGEIHPR